jgi:tRNA pseudouridine38-40 synthase
MVRNIAGSLMAVGTGSKSEAWIGQLMEVRDRTQAADTAAPHGLYLVAVDYPLIYDLPILPLGPLILSS